MHWRPQRSWRKTTRSNKRDMRCSTGPVKTKHRHDGLFTTDVKSPTHSSIGDGRQSFRTGYAFFWEATLRELRSSAEQFPTHENFQATPIVCGFRLLRFPYSSFRNEYGAIAHRSSQSVRLDPRMCHSTGVFTLLFGRQNNEPGSAWRSI